MKVLIACEFSGIVRDAFTKKGHDAISCDLLPTETNGPHFTGDILYFLALHNYFDLIIAHPECTKVCVSGNRTYAKGKGRYQERIDAAWWIYNFWCECKIKAKRVCFENPVGVLCTVTPMPKPQYIQPWQFGHGETKKTGLHLYNLPPLKPTKIVSGRENIIHRMAPSKDRWKKRSTTYIGIAEAMADQWG
jgi:hypothetical protein